MNKLTSRNLTLIALCAVIALFAVAPIRAAEAAAAQAAVSPAQTAQQPAAPLPIFLASTATYLCSYDIVDPCTGGFVATCSTVCDVGQSCHCGVQYGHRANGCAYVTRISEPFCF